MNRIIQIKVFNDILDQFLEYMKDEFQYFRSDIILTQSAIGFIRKSNPRLVVEQFIQHITPYSKQITECNEDFFLNFEDTMNLKNDNLLFGLKLKSIWLDNEDTKESEKQKAIIFFYFQKMLKCASKIN